MNIDQIRSKLEQYFNSEKGFIIIRSSYNNGDDLKPYCIVLRQGGFVFSQRKGKCVMYMHNCVFSGLDIEKVFYTESKDLVDKVLDGTFSVFDELGRNISEVKIDDQEKDTSDIMNKYGLV